MHGFRDFFQRDFLAVGTGYPKTFKGLGQLLAGITVACVGINKVPGQGLDLSAGFYRKAYCAFFICCGCYRLLRESRFSCGKSICCKGKYKCNISKYI